MKKIALFAVICLAVSACEPTVENPEDLNSIPEEVGNITPEV